MNDLQAGSQQTGFHELARYVLDADLKFEPHVALDKFGGGDVVAARDHLKRTLKPLREIEPKLDGSECSKVDKALRMIGIKVMPTMSPDQCGAWLKAVLAALSDLPPHIAIKASGQAIHTPFRFIAEVEGHIRTQAEALVERQRMAIRRLDRMLAEIRGDDRVPTDHRIEDKVEPISDDEVHAMQKTAVGRELIRMGLAKGWITQDQLEPMEGDQDHG